MMEDQTESVRVALLQALAKETANPDVCINALVQMFVFAMVSRHLVLKLSKNETTEAIVRMCGMICADVIEGINQEKGTRYDA